MKWLRSLLGRDPDERERKGVEVAELHKQSRAAIARGNAALERERIILATRGTVSHLRRIRT